LKLEESERELSGGHNLKMPVCSFCKHSYEFPKGTTVVQKDGNIKFFCNSKCRKNSEMGRDNKKVKWVRKSDLVKADKSKKDAARQKLMEDKKAELEIKKQKEEAKRVSKKEKKASKKSSN